MFMRKKSISHSVLRSRTRLCRGMVLALITALLFTFGSCPAAADTHASLDVSAQSAILMEAMSGEVIYQKNADLHLPMASTTKIMTALVAIDKMPLDTVIEVSPAAVGIEGSSVYLFAGERLTLEELLYAMLLESANDAATAIAVAISGSVEDFAVLMNQKAEDLGLTDTHFTNPHGLDHEEHYTTARELGLIAAEVLRCPELQTITSTRQKNISHNGSGGIRLLINHNKLLRSYEGCIGLKTGFTKRSGRCLVSAAERDGVTLIAVTLNAPNDWNDHEAMLDHGFAAYESVLLCEVGDYRRPLWIESGTQSYVMVENREALAVTVPVRRGDIRVTVELPRFEYAPVLEGTQMGRLVYRVTNEDGHDTVIGTVPLYAAYDVKAADYSLSIWDRIKAFFHIS